MWTAGRKRKHAGGRGSDLMVFDWYQCFAAGQLWWQWGVHSEHTVFAQRRSDLFGVDAFWQHEFTIVFPVHALGVGLFLVFGMDLEMVAKKDCLSFHFFQISES